MAEINTDNRTTGYPNPGQRATTQFAKIRQDTGDIEMEDSSDEYGGKDVTEVTTPVKPWGMSQRKRADVAAFDRWIEENQKHLSDTRRKRPLGGDRKYVSGLSVALEKEKIITSPRDYQIELFEKAKKQNTIAVLDTGM